MDLCAGLSIAPLAKADAEVVKRDAVHIEMFAAGAENRYELRREIQDLPKLHFLLPDLFFGNPPLFLRLLEFLNVEVYPDPVQQRPVSCSQRFEPAEEPSVFSFRVSYSECCLAGTPGSVTGFPDSQRLFMIIGMYQLDVGVSGDRDLHPEPQRIILGETKVISVSFIDEREGAGWQRVPCECRNCIERLS